MRALLIQGVLLILTFSVTSAYAQLPGVDQTIFARGSTDYAAEVGGPADLTIGWIALEPGARYGGWHTDPGVVWVVVTSGELTVYGPDGCPTRYLAGTAYRGEPDTLYDLRNESSAKVEMAFSGVGRRGVASTLFPSEGGPVCRT